VIEYRSVDEALGFRQWSFIFELASMISWIALAAGRAFQKIGRNVFPACLEN
jgi:hypothetical protein